MTKFFLIAATMLSIAASPAIARETRSLPAVAVPAASVQEGGATRAVNAAPVASPTQKYCTINQVTGSHIPVKTCLTRQQWLEEGYDPLAK